MKKQEATQLLDKTFNNAFDINQVARFVKEVFNTIDIQYLDKSQYIANQYREYISEVTKLGSYTKDRKKLEILVVKLKKTRSRDRARTMQRNFIANWLNKMDIDAALVAFHGEEPEDWRFSFVKMEYNLVRDEEGKVKIAKELTPAKRYSYLVGVNEPNHTCRSQFLNLVRDEDIQPSLSDIENAFSIEKVTKEFFEKYKECVIDLRESLDKVVAKDERIQKEFEECGIDTIDFSKKLLGQVVFIYFLQKKGWLGIKREKNGEFAEWGTGPKDFMRRLFNGKYGDYDNFFNDMLEPLFYQALANDRSADNDYYDKFKCKIPFLNGGLFEPINEYNWVKTDILIENKVFKEILKTFDEFNFTVKEDEPLEKEVAVDPEMMGKVFENLLGVKERKDKGAFYTPREIVHYMCQQSLINYLETNTSVSKEDIERFIQLGDLTLANDQRILMDLEAKREKLDKGIINQSTYEKEIDQLLDSFGLPRSIIEKKEIIDKLLQEIKIVDPAVGSGAFPVGMMNEIVKARSVVTIFFDPDEQEERNVYKLKRDCIENSLYGVDIDPSAVEIAKLRFWLALIVDEEKKENIKPLPNLDHKIMCGNSLLEEFEGIKLFDESLLEIVEAKSAQQYEIEEIKKQLESLYKLKGRIVLGQEKGESLQDVEKKISKLERKRKGLLKPKADKTSITTLEEALQQKKRESQRKLNELRKLHKEYFNEESRDKKKALREKIDTLEWKLIETTLEEQDHPEALQKLEQYKKSQSKPFFLWKLYFAEIFQRENPGFDVVIANPPYIQIQKLAETTEQKDLENQKYSTFEKTGDIYCLFYEKGNNLLRKNGVQVFISSNKWMRAKYGEKLRRYFVTHTNPLVIIDFSGYQVFETAMVDTNILLFTKNRNQRNTVGCIIKEDFNEEIPLSSYISNKSTILDDLSEEIWLICSDEEYNIKQKIENVGIPLKDWNVQINFGIKTGYNEAFIIDEAEKNRIISLDPKNEDIIKPILRGRDIKKYSAEFCNKWLISTFPALKIDINDYPIIRDYLLSYGKRLDQTGETYVDENRNRQKTRKKTGNRWFETQDQISYYREFSKEKILYPDIMRLPRNSEDFNEYPFMYFDRCGYYPEATAFLITGEQIRTIYAFLTSSLGIYSFINFYSGPRFDNKGFRYKKAYLEKIPISKLSEEKEEILAGLIDKILAITENNEYEHLSNKQEEIRKLEKEINEFFYRLYGLTRDEIRIVEEFVNNTH